MEMKDKILRMALKDLSDVAFVAGMTISSWKAWQTISVKDLCAGLRLQRILHRQLIDGLTPFPARCHKES